MTSATEAAAAKNQFAADAKAGVDTLSLDQKITFTAYVRLVLPLDGYIFWVRADLVSKGALYNALRYNAAAYNAGPKIVTPAPTLTAMGSLHYATNLTQNEDDFIAVNRVVFTSEREVQDLNATGPNLLYIAEVDQIKFAFSQRASFYRQAGLWHYVGMAVYPTFETQLINSLDGFDTRNVIVSNSLPIWLALNNYQSLFPDRLTPLPLPLFPSFATPQDIVPPYAAVHIPPESTKAIQSAPYLDRTLNHWQLVEETVRITLYGLRNFNALSFLDCVNQYSLDTGAFGIMNMPVPRDEKRTQVELGALAMKKTIEFRINYNQAAARNIARQLIESCSPVIIPKDNPLLY